MPSKLSCGLTVPKTASSAIDHSLCTIMEIRKSKQTKFWREKLQRAVDDAGDLVECCLPLLFRYIIGIKVQIKCSSIIYYCSTTVVYDRRTLYLKLYT